MAPELSSKAHDLLIDRTKEHESDVVRLATGLSEETLSSRAKPAQWSLKELVCHLDRIQRVFDGRVSQMVSSERPAIVPYDPDEDKGFAAFASRPTSLCLETFRQGRAELLARLGRLEPSQWHREGSHPAFPHYDVHFAVEYMVRHEAHHLYQMFERRAVFGPLPH